MPLITETIGRLYDFKPGKKAFSAQVNDELNQIIEAINNAVSDLGTLDTDKATVKALENLAGIGRTTETVKQNADDIKAHKTSGDHDHRYYTKVLLDGGQLDNRYYTKALLDGGQLDNRYYTETEIDNKLASVNIKYTGIKAELTQHKTSADHDGRYYTKEELQEYLRGGDTDLKEEVYEIVNPNNGDGTFSYTNGVDMFIGELTPEGYQVINLIDGYYMTGKNRVYAIINDTIRVSRKSGGLIELSETSTALS